MTAKVLVGDCREVLLTLDANSIDACVCDPPHGLEFMGKEWDRLGAGIKVESQRTDDFAMQRGGSLPFGGGGRSIAYGQNAKSMQAWHETWAREVYRVLKPGAHLLAFSGTRTSHRMVCAIEDAGFEIRDCLMWLYGSGFPKSLDVSKALDKAAGVEREVVGQTTKARSTNGASALPTLGAGVQYQTWDETAPATDLARRWDGWGTALKPAYEPIILARKPLAGTVAANVTQYGVGALNIAATRIGNGGQLQWAEPRDMGYHGGTDNGTVDATANALGRWPANLVLDEDAARLLDEMSGERPSGAWNGNRNTPKTSGIYGDFVQQNEQGKQGDTGGASRFFLYK
jgi:hypothetical protein